MFLTFFILKIFTSCLFIFQVILNFASPEEKKRRKITHSRPRKKRVLRENFFSFINSDLGSFLLYVISLILPSLSCCLVISQFARIMFDPYFSMQKLSGTNLFPRSCHQYIPTFKNPATTCVSNHFWFKSISVISNHSWYYLIPRLVANHGRLLIPTCGCKPRAVANHELLLITSGC